MKEYIYLLDLVRESEDASLVLGGATASCKLKLIGSMVQNPFPTAEVQMNGPPEVLPTLGARFLLNLWERCTLQSSLRAFGRSNKRQLGAGLDLVK